MESNAPTQLPDGGNPGTITIPMILFALWISWWLCALELVVSLLDWQGLALLGRRWRWITLGLFVGLSVRLLSQLSRGRWWLIPLAGLVGLLIFGIAVTWRRRQLSPAALFAPGLQGGRRVHELAIPLQGGPLPAILVEPESGSRVGILVVHGAGDHKTHFTWPLLHSLVDAGFGACAIDVDGHGDNPRTLAFPTVLENVVAGVAWLRERYSQVAVLGISQGGCIVARAVAEGLAADAVVLLETPTTVHITRAVIRAEMRILAHPAAWALHRDVGSLALARSWRTAPTRTTIGTVDLIERLDVLGSVWRISAPLLLVYGGRDAVVPLAQGRAVAAAAPAGTTLLVVPRATHLSLSIDRRVGQMVAAWLRQQFGAVHQKQGPDNP